LVVKALKYALRVVLYFVFCCLSGVRIVLSIEIDLDPRRHVVESGVPLKERK
jgi:hypothetical protein